MNSLATLNTIEIEYGPKAYLLPFQYHMLNTYFFTDEFKKIARIVTPSYANLSWTDTEP